MPARCDAGYMNTTHASPGAQGHDPATTVPAVSITGLSRHFGIGERRVQAVKGIDLTIQRGEVVALLGPNGAGKTTTLDMLLGLSEPDSGTVQVLGERPRHATAAGKLAAVLQTGGLLADVTVRESIEIIAGFHRATNRIDEIMERTGLTEIARRKIGKCSGGEQQRVKFALALLPDPDVLVLDEPTAGMDVNARRKFWDIMRKDASAGRTIIFATHYLEEAEQFARRTVVMNHGKIIADSDTSQLRASLGGRTLAATLPGESDAEHRATIDRIIAEGPLEGETSAEIRLDGARVTVRTQHSDAVAAQVLALGATDLEITAPTLETAFTALTEK